MYVEDAIGSPTLEMWVASWNQVEEMELYCNNEDEWGYSVGNTVNPTGSRQEVSSGNSLFFQINFNNVRFAEGITTGLLLLHVGKM